MGNQEAFLMVEEATLGRFKAKEGGRILSEGVTQLGVEVLAILIVPLIHGSYLIVPPILIVPLRKIRFNFSD